MGAAAFKAVLKFRFQNGETIAYPCTVSDVNGEFYVFQDSLPDVVLPGTKGTAALVDIILSAAGTDTSTADIFVNGRSTPFRIMNSANLATNSARQFYGAPMLIEAGSRVKIKQNT